MIGFYMLSVVCMAHSIITVQEGTVTCASQREGAMPQPSPLLWEAVRFSEGLEALRKQAAYLVGKTMT